MEVVDPSSTQKGEGQLFDSEEDTSHPKDPKAQSSRKDKGLWLSSKTVVHPTRRPASKRDEYVGRERLHRVYSTKLSLIMDRRLYRTYGLDRDWISDSR